VRDFDAFHLTAGYFAGDHLSDDLIIGAYSGYGWMEARNRVFGVLIVGFQRSDAAREAWDAPIGALPTLCQRHRLADLQFADVHN
jgi:hypothetical protein